MAAPADSRALDARAAREPVVSVLSSAPSLISGGDALLHIVVPEQSDSSTLRVDVDERDVTSLVVSSGNRRFHLVDGLKLGINRITARVRGAPSSGLDLVNHPLGGPVFSGPQVQPWLCETEGAGLGPAADDLCNARRRIELFYKSATTGRFLPYTGPNPPDGVAWTTTDNGNPVPYIVQRETGTINRGIYWLAVLHDPAKDWRPWSPQRGWNQKLLYLFEGGATPNHRQGTVAGDVLNDMALSRGFAVASATLNVFGQNLNFVTSAETLMMVKERLVEKTGEIRYTIGRGCSGGSIQQHLIAEGYPNLLDGIIPTCSFADLLTLASFFAADCGLLLRYFRETSPHLWPLERQQAAVTGHASVSSCEAVVTETGLDRTFWDPRVGCMGQSWNPEGLQPEPAYVYHPETNPTGVRCTIQDFQAAIYGFRDRTDWGPVERQIGRGFAGRPYDNVGVQYGLLALESGLVTTQQFIDLNERIGGRDIDYRWQPERSTADMLALRRAYRSGQLNSVKQLATVPIIDIRGASNFELHNDVNTYVMRERLTRAHGHAGKHVIWLTPSVQSAQPNEAQLTEEAFDLLDRWLMSIENDASVAPLADKVIKNKPPQAVDSCWIDNRRIVDQTVCRAGFPYFADPRMAAGGPLSNDVLKCRLKPLDPGDFSVAFTPDEWSRLGRAFPLGVCDYHQPGVGSVRSLPWLSYQDGPDGRQADAW